jgi:hypothetical protein
MALYMCPHTSQYCCDKCFQEGSIWSVYAAASADSVPLLLNTIQYCSDICFQEDRCIYVSSYSYRCFLILLHVCPHTTIYVFSYSYVCVLILLYMCLHTPIYVSSYYYMCVLILIIRVLILLYMCPHTTQYYSVLQRHLFSRR